MSGIGVSGGTPAPGVGSMQPVCMLASEKAQGLRLPLEKVENEVKIIWVVVWAIALGPYGNKTQYPGLAQLVARLLWDVRPRFEPQPSENPESLGTLGLTALFPSPATGQKPALTPYLTTVGKFHNRV